MCIFVGDDFIKMGQAFFRLDEEYQKIKVKTKQKKFPLIFEKTEKKFSENFSFDFASLLKHFESILEQKRENVVII